MCGAGRFDPDLRLAGGSVRRNGAASADAAGLLVVELIVWHAAGRVLRASSHLIESRGIPIWVDI
jgi:hypothetical protein